ncbi:hypothetical protein FHP29_20720 [Nocardioides albidus]|uniref:DUF559 domain-containing protein n=1 Tax=Nocardioides albidus TaxID=1517589 RepID=A0A5C4VLQ1_9ACTN|nr:hypothetical protein [Nocardioides albidus]TNM36555.1 hypothetical protein FHP29_20720 [Nocardioides albidus]
MNPDVLDLAAGQAGLIARRQLTALGCDWDRVQRQVGAGRWAERSPRVLSITTGELTTEQRRWLGVLHAGPRSIVGGLTAGARHGLRGWERSDVTVLVDDELAFEPVDGIRFFRSRRPFDLLRDPRPGIPSARLEWVEQLRPLRRAGGFRRMLHDVEGGVHSGAERDVARLCRRFGLPLPVRQTSRVDSAGRRRWTDCEWRLGGGRVLVLEVDGSFHVEVEQWIADLRRDRRLTAAERVVVRASAFEIRHEPEEVARDLVALGVRPLDARSCA